MARSGWRLERVIRNRFLVHGAAVAWMVVAAIIMLAPAISHGMSLGPSDILSSFGLTTQPGVVVHNPLSTDQILQFIPWTILAWKQVHHGLLPLWNPYSVLGVPLAFNWQSAPFSVPSLIGYLFPLNFAYTVAVVARLAIAGTGGYALGRVMKMSWLASTLTGIVFELSGSLSGWAGWPMVNVLAWAGWSLAAMILLLRGRHRTRDTVLLAISVGLAIYGGHPESVALLLLFLVVFAVVLLLARTVRCGASELWSGVNVAVGLLGGFALAAPLVFPGLQVVRASARSATLGFPVLPVQTAVGFAFSSFYGLPVAGSRWFGPSDYYEVAAYVGIIALVLSAVALFSRWKEPEVLAISVVGIVMVGVVYSATLRSVLNAVPDGKEIAWSRALILTALPIAVLAGLGLDTLVTAFWRRRTVGVAFAGFGIAALALAVLAGFMFESHIKGPDATIRHASFFWPVGSTAIGLLVTFFLWNRHPPASRHRRRPVLGRGWIAGLVLLLTETAFLVAAGAPLWSASPAMLPRSTSVSALQRTVGSSLVGFADCPTVGGWAPLGILPDANVGYPVTQFAIYDPALPAAYYKSWSAATGQEVSSTSGIFCPSITNARLARLYGVAFVLQTAGRQPVAGAIFDKRIDGEDLYRIPGAAQATLVPRAASANDMVGVPVAVGHPNPTTWRLVSSVKAASELRLRLTDTPGWHATIDGHPVALHQWAGVMLETQVPPGRHFVVVQYEPNRFIEGLVVAAATLFVMIAALSLSLLRRRSRRQSTT